MNGNSDDVDRWIIGIIQSYGVVNIQHLCRIMNGREFKWCHSKQPRGTEYDKRMDGQFVKQCNDCSYHYRDVHKKVMKLIKEKRIKSDKRIFFDVINDEQDRRFKGNGRRKDLFRFLFVDDEVFKRKVSDHTLEKYIFE